MYSQEEIQVSDKIINKHYLDNQDIGTKLAQSIHDFSMLLLHLSCILRLLIFSDALHDYLEGKTVVGVMGGHRTNRESPEYEQVVRLARQVVQAGFVIGLGIRAIFILTLSYWWRRWYHGSCKPRSLPCKQD